MKTSVNKNQQNKTQSGAKNLTPGKLQAGLKSRIEDKRPEALAQMKLRNMALEHTMGHQVAQLQLIANVQPIQMYPGEDDIRKLKAKYRKERSHLVNTAKGVVEGGGWNNRYMPFDEPTEQDHYHDILDEEAEARDRLERHPVAERARRYGLPVAKVLAKTGAEAGGNALAGPVGGAAAKKAVGMGIGKLGKWAKARLNKGGSPYKVIRHEEDEE